MAVMKTYDVLKYLGITPVLPRRDFPGAARNDDFASVWGSVSSLSTSATAQQQVDDLVGGRPDSKAGLSQRAETLNQQAKAEHMGVVDVKPSPNQALATRAEPSPICQPSSDSTVDLNIPTPAVKLQFDLIVLQHAGLNTLVLAELQSTQAPSTQEQLALLKKIVLSFSQGQEQQWRQKRFSWPLRTNVSGSLQSELSAAQDMLYGYLEGLQPQPPTQLLCFNALHLNRLLAIEPRHSERGIELLECSAIWPSVMVTQLAGLSSYAQDSALKKELWGYIKQYLLQPFE